MKIKKLLLVGLLVSIGMNVFAQNYYKRDGVIYIISTTNTATVAGVSTGMSAATVKTLTINSTVVDGEGNSLPVQGFEANWQTPQTFSTSPEIKSQEIVDKVETLTVDISKFTETGLSNFAARVGVLASASDKAFSVNIKGEITNDYTVPTIDYVKNLSLANLSLASGKKITVNGGGADLESLTLPDATTVIADNAFASHAKIATVTLGGSTEVGVAAFKAAAKLKTITTAKITKFGKEAFAGGTIIESVDLSAAKTIGLDAFKGNAKIAEITIPAQVEEIATNAFNGMSALKTVTINLDNDKLKEIGQWFAATTGTITTLTINTPQVTKIAANAFAKEPIESLTITAAKLTEIGANAFAAAVDTKLTAIDLSNCTALKTVDATSFPALKYTSVKLKGTAIDDANFANAATWWSNAQNDLTEITLPDGLETISANAFQNFDKLESVGLPKSLKTVEDYAFAGSALKKITFKGAIVEIGDNAFDGCTALAAADFTNATELKAIGNDAFYGTALTALDLSACGKLVTIGDEAFMDCADLATLNLSGCAELTTIGTDAFTGTAVSSLNLSGCAKLATVTTTSFPANEYTKVLLSGTPLTDANWTEIGAWLANSAATLKEITLPSAITVIPNSQFQDYTALTSISLPKAVTTIGGSAFEGSGLTSFKVRENVLTIDDSAFENCSGLEIVNFSEATALVSIGTYAFANTAIKEVAIPANAANNVLAIGASAFEDCAKLKSFSAKSWGEDDGGNTYLAKKLFKGCVKLGGIKVPTTLTKIDDEAFSGCTALQNVIFNYADADDGLKDGIGANAFENCSAMASLDLSTTQLTILNAPEIFKGCTALATITFPEELTTILTDGIFASCPIEILDATNVTTTGILFGKYYDKKGNLQNRNEKHANTTLTSVVIGGKVPANCFAYCTALEEVEVIPTAAPAANDVAANAFIGCTGLTSFTYETKTADPIAAGVVNADAFADCTPYIQFNTNQLYIDANPIAPWNSSYEGGVPALTVVKTVVDKANPNQCFGKFYNPSIDVRIAASECKLFSIYVDEETIYYQACRVVDNYYNVLKGQHVIVKTSEPATINFKAYNTGSKSSVGFDDVYASKDNETLSSIQKNLNPQDSPKGLKAGQYVYRLTNTDDIGFGFTHFTGTTAKAGQFFVACSALPPVNGRLNEVWLDEDGNVIDGDATAIKGVKKALDQNDGAIYNLQGVRVQKAQKGGIYIQNGKKFVVK